MEVADGGEQVGVAGPLAVPVGGALEVPTPASTAAIVLATAQEVSFWQWMPSRSGASRRSRSTTSSIAAVIIDGSMPPLVSHMTTRSAPASNAAATTDAVYVRVEAEPVEEVLAVEEDAAALGDAGSATVSRTIARFSSPVVRSARSTCRMSDLATRQTTGVSASSSACTCGSVGHVDAGLAGRAERDQHRVLEVELGLRARAKNSVSLGIAPGQPPSMKPTPNSSSSRATASLSATE